MKRLIKADTKQKKALQKLFGCTLVTVNRTLRYESVGSYRNVQLRKAAMEMGATYYESKIPTTADLKGQDE